MRKIFTIGIACMAVLALVTAPVFAGPSCGGAKSDVKKTSASASTCDLSKADGKLTTASANACSAADKAACAAKLGISAEQCEELCKSGSLTMVNMSVKGMTCGACENTIKTALEAVPGIVNVGSVCYKSGTASVYLDSRKGKSDAVVQAVANSGYTAEIIPAVATMTTTTDKVEQVNAKTCDVGAAACCPKGKGASTTKTNATKASAGGTK